MIKDLISVIMPTFNRAHLLMDRINEYLNQVYNNWELIIVDDCSVDDTEKIINSLKDERIKYIKLHENSGCVSIPRNIGIISSNGEFIVHADDDDIHLPNQLEALYIIIKNIDTASLAYGDRIEVRNGSEKTVETPNWNPKIMWGVGNGQFIYRKSCFQSIPLVFCRRACDWELCKYLYDIGEFIHIAEVVKKYIWHGKNRSLDESTKHKPLMLDKFMKYIPTNYNIKIVQ